MVRRHWEALAGLAVAVLLATAGTALARVGTAPVNESVAATQAQTQAQKDKILTAGEKEAKKLLLLMDKDQNGKVSKNEFMGFMEAEFELLDKDKSGELDVHELTQSPVRSSGAIHR
jgi:hypothetical protein